MTVITIVDLPRTRYRLLNPITKWQLLAGVVSVVCSALAYGLLG